MKELSTLRIKTDCASCINKCCSQPYDWVCLTSEETRRLEAASGVAAHEFSSERTNRATGQVVKTLDLPCRFLNSATGECTVYEARPLGCRLFPFHLDPLTGNATMYGVECGDHLLFPDNDDQQGWCLGDMEDDARDWLAEFWNEAEINQHSGQPGRLGPQDLHKAPQKTK